MDRRPPPATGECELGGPQADVTTSAVAVAPIFAWLKRFLMSDFVALVVLAGVIAFAIERYARSQRVRLELRMESRQEAYYEPPDWAERRAYVLNRDGNKCVRCGGSDSLHVHHRVPRAVRIDHSVANLMTLCFRCHGREHGVTFLDNNTLAQRREESHRRKRAEMFRAEARKSPLIRCRVEHVCQVCGRLFPPGTYYSKVQAPKGIIDAAGRYSTVAAVCSTCRDS